MRVLENGNADEIFPKVDLLRNIERLSGLALIILGERMKMWFGVHR